MDIESFGKLKQYIAEFVESGKGSDAVRDYLNMAQYNDAILTRFLKARKNRPEHAWQTLKRYAEVRFDIYPGTFPQEYSEATRGMLSDSQALGVLKSRDKLGRRVCIVDISKWDPDKYPTKDGNIAIVSIAEKLLLDEDCMENGLIYLENCSGVTLKHAKQFTFRLVREVIDIYLHALPLSPKGFYFVNVPTFFSIVIKMFTFFFPKKLKERVIITSDDLPDCQEICDLIPIKHLPTAFGGPLEFHEAVDEHFITV